MQVIYRLTLTHIDTGKDATIILGYDHKSESFASSDFEGLESVVTEGMAEPLCIFLEDAAMEAANVLNVERQLGAEVEEEEEDDEADNGADLEDDLDEEEEEEE